MKKSIILSLLLACFSLGASAQFSGEGVTKKHYNYQFSIGVHAMGGVSMLSEGDGLEIYDGSSLSFGGGVAANVRFGGKDSRGRNLDGQGMFGLGAELNYKQYTMKTLGNDDLKLGYFEVPILVQFYPFYNGKQLRNFYIEAGPTIAGSLSSKPDVLICNTMWCKTGDLKGFDIKASVGLGYRFDSQSANSGFYVSARYNFGTSDLAGNFPAKVSSAELTIGYMFGCIGGKK